MSLISRSAADADAILTSAKRYAPDWHAAALLAPRDARDDLLIIAAFTGEVNRILFDVSEPMLGEIRVQWWRDSLGLGEETASSFVEPTARTGHPIADAMQDLIQRRQLDRSRLTPFLDAHGHALHAEAPRAWDAVEQDCDATDGATFALAASVLGCKPTDATRDAGRAYGLMRRARELPMRLAKGHIPFPMQHENANPDWRNITAEADRRAAIALNRVRAAPIPDKRLITAMLPCAVIEPYFKSLQRLDGDPSRQLTELSPLTRVWAIGKAHMRGRI
jgi:15-cis-phytoene synthase